MFLTVNVLFNITGNLVTIIGRFLKIFNKYNSALLNHIIDHAAHKRNNL